MSETTSLVERASGLLGELVTIAETIKDDIQSSQSSLQMIGINITRVQDKHSRLVRECGTKKEAMFAELKAVEKSLEATRSARDKLAKEVEDLVSKKGTLQIENARIEDTNRKARLWESQSLKVLGAKENELIEREQAVEQRENLNPRGRSLLPPKQ